MRPKFIVSIFFIVIACCTSLLVFGQTPVATPVPTPNAATGIASWIQTQGGFVAAVGVVIGCLNIVFSALTSLFAKLSVTEPGFMQTIGAILLKVTQLLSANTPSPQNTQAAADATATAVAAVQTKKSS